VSGAAEAASNPLLRTAVFTSTFPRPLGELTTAPAGEALLRATAPDIPLQRDEAVRSAIRDVLRQGGYKPTGRGKPASEYLVRAAEEGTLQPINAAVDAGNVVSLHSGLPISVIDLDRATPPLRIAVGKPGEGYAFNASGQEIEVAGLPCLFDASGPCGNAVKDAQRTKTHAGTERTLSVIWGAVGHEARLAAALAWYRDLLAQVGAHTEEVALAQLQQG
jgi:DNA/RNA-binding domain of Phe-tRNA-synthetase-like protein